MSRENTQTVLLKEKRNIIKLPLKRNNDGNILKVISLVELLRKEIKKTVYSVVKHGTR